MRESVPGSAKGPRKNKFIEGAFLSYIAIVITKLLGALYNIPFSDIIGERGKFIYAVVYNVYSLFLDISTSGIPIAIASINELGSPS